MAKREFNASEDSRAIFAAIFFLGITIWGLIDITRNGLSRLYQLPLFLVFTVGLFIAALFTLINQTRLRICPKCKTLMSRVTPQADGVRRQQCPQCAAIISTGRKGAFPTGDIIEDHGHQSNP